VGVKVAKSLDWLPLDERLRCYRQFAQDAFRQAGETGDANCRAEFFNMAAGWHSLADEIERSAKADPLMGIPQTCSPSGRGN
jgi:hypothetical protein